MLHGIGEACVPIRICRVRASARHQHPADGRCATNAFRIIGHDGILPVGGALGGGGIRLRGPPGSGGVRLFWLWGARRGAVAAEVAHEGARVSRLWRHGLDGVPPQQAPPIMGPVLHGAAVRLEGAKVLALVQGPRGESVEEFVDLRGDRRTLGSAAEAGAARVLELRAHGSQWRDESPDRLRVAVPRCSDVCGGRCAAAGHGYPRLALHPVRGHAEIIGVGRAALAATPGTGLPVDEVAPPLPPRPAVDAPQAEVPVPNLATTALAPLPQQAPRVCRRHSRISEVAETNGLGVRQIRRRVLPTPVGFRGRDICCERAGALCRQVTVLTAAGVLLRKLARARSRSHVQDTSGGSRRVARIRGASIGDSEGDKVTEKKRAAGHETTRAHLRGRRWHLQLRA
mmetsp:Transcript_63928/g.181496  ORF Transcript_63928/g.181496 Transcript_63928/m.181496 type:complete len:400 (+) Transcript_63928:238-1437(+)